MAQTPARSKSTPLAIAASAATASLFAVFAMATTAALSLCGSAQAQGFDAVRLYGVRAAQDGGTVGLGLINSRAYLGSDERRTMLRPLVDYQWRNGWFAGTANGLGVDLSEQAGRHYGLRLTADFGRDESRSDALRGLGDIPLRPELGGFFNLAVARGLVLTSSLRFGAGEDRDGAQLDLGAVSGLPLSPTVRLSLSAGMTWVNTALSQTYFGINPEQSQASGLRQYSAGSGLRDVRLGTAVVWQFAPRWNFTTVLSGGHLLGDAQRSPVTRQVNSVSAVLGSSYSF